MTTEEKVDLLYRKARGGRLSIMQYGELKDYKVSKSDGSFLATKKNLRDYVLAVDNGVTQKNFYTWCMDEGRADARRKGGKAGEIKDSISGLSGSAFILGALPWAMAVMVFLEAIGIEVDDCGPYLIVGGIISCVLYRKNRKHPLVTILWLPLIVFGVLATLFNLV